LQGVHVSIAARPAHGDSCSAAREKRVNPLVAMAHRGRRMTEAPARGGSDQGSGRSKPIPAPGSLLVLFLAAVLLGVNGTTPESNDVFLLLPASSTSPSGSAAAPSTEPVGNAEASPPAPRRPSNLRDEGGRRLLVLRPAGKESPD
jgi:hypothetical protein